MIRILRGLILTALIFSVTLKVTAEESTKEIPELIPNDPSITESLKDFIRDRSEDYPDRKDFVLKTVFKTSYDAFYEYKKKQLRKEIKDTITNDSTVFIVTARFAPNKEVDKESDIGYINIGEYTFILRNLIGEKFPLDIYFRESDKKQKFKIKGEIDDSIKRRPDDRFWTLYFLDGKLHQLFPPKSF